MAEKLAKKTWTDFSKEKKLDLDDGALLKALDKFEKTDESESEPYLVALQEVIEQLKKQVSALAKRKKELGDKPFNEAKDKVYGLLEVAERLEKDTRKAAEAVKAAGKEEEDSPALLTSKMIPLIREVRKGDAVMPALIAVAGKETVVLLSRKAISPARGKLLKEQMTNPGGLKFIRGECLLEDNKLTFVVQAQASGLAKRLTAALLKQTELRLKVRVRGEDPADVEEDGEDEGAGASAPGATTATGAGSAADDAARKAEAEALKLRFEQRMKGLEGRVAEALRLQQGDVSKIRAVAAFASEKGAAGSYAAALQALDALEKLIAAPVKKPGGGDGGGTEANSFKTEWAKAFETFRDAIEQVDSQMGALGSACRQSGSAVLQSIADLGLPAVTLNHKTPLMAACIDVTESSDDKVAAAAAKARMAIGDFARHIASSPLVAACDSNPFGVKVSIRGTLVPALQTLNAALRRVA
jgi:molybdenum-dependent DNA-binding transcriptional regulator ModE